MLALERQRKVVSELRDLRDDTARFIAGCYS